MTASYPASTASHSTVTIPSGFVDLEGELILPDYASGVVVFAHGSGSSRHSPRNQYVAEVIREAGIGTLLLDLLTLKEEQQDAITGALRFDTDLLGQRLIGVTRWLEKQPATHGLKVGYFGASTGAAAALLAAAELGDQVAAIVSRGGRPDLAGNALQLVCSPTLLIVGGYDEMVICLNNEAYDKMRCVKEIRIIPGATHLFEEPGKLGAVAQLSTDWFIKYLGTPDEEEDDT